MEALTPALSHPMGEGEAVGCPRLTAGCEGNAVEGVRELRDGLLKKYAPVSKIWLGFAKGGKAAPAKGF
jgi:hypothetical protein